MQQVPGLCGSSGAFSGGGEGSYRIGTHAGWFSGALRGWRQLEVSVTLTKTVQRLHISTTPVQEGRGPSRVRATTGQKGPLPQTQKVTALWQLQQLSCVETWSPRFVHVLLETVSSAGLILRVLMSWGLTRLSEERFCLRNAVLEESSVLLKLLQRSSCLPGPAASDSSGP